MCVTWRLSALEFVASSKQIKHILGFQYDQHFQTNETLQLNNIQADCKWIILTLTTLPTARYI